MEINITGTAIYKIMHLARYPKPGSDWAGEMEQCGKDKNCIPRYKGWKGASRDGMTVDLGRGNEKLFDTGIAKDGIENLQEKDLKNITIKIPGARGAGMIMIGNDFKEIWKYISLEKVPKVVQKIAGVASIKEPEPEPEQKMDNALMDVVIKNLVSLIKGEGKWDPSWQSAIQCNRMVNPEELAPILQKSADYFLPAIGASWAATGHIKSAAIDRRRPEAYAQLTSEEAKALEMTPDEMDKLPEAERNKAIMAQRRARKALAIIQKGGAEGAKAIVDAVARWGKGFIKFALLRVVGGPATMLLLSWAAHLGVEHAGADEDVADALGVYTFLRFITLGAGGKTQIAAGWMTLIAAALNTTSQAATKGPGLWCAIERSLWGIAFGASLSLGGALLGPARHAILAAFAKDGDAEKAIEKMYRSVLQKFAVDAEDAFDLRGVFAAAREIGERSPGAWGDRIEAVYLRVLNKVISETKVNFEKTDSLLKLSDENLEILLKGLQKADPKGVFHPETVKASMNNMFIKPANERVTSWLKKVTKEINDEAKTAFEALKAEFDNAQRLNKAFRGPKGKNLKWDEVIELIKPVLDGMVRTHHKQSFKGLLKIEKEMLKLESEATKLVDEAIRTVNTPFHRSRLGLSTRAEIEPVVIDSKRYAEIHRRYKEFMSNARTDHRSSGRELMKIVDDVVGPNAAGALPSSTAKVKDELEFLGSELVSNHKAYAERLSELKSELDIIDATNFALSKASKEFIPKSTQSGDLFETATEFTHVAFGKAFMEDMPGRLGAARLAKVEKHGGEWLVHPAGESLTSAGQATKRGIIRIFQSSPIGKRMLAVGAIAAGSGTMAAMSKAGRGLHNYFTKGPESEIQQKALVAHIYFFLLMGAIKEAQEAAIEVSSSSNGGLGSEQPKMSGVFNLGDFAMKVTVKQVEDERYKLIGAPPYRKIQTFTTEDEFGPIRAGIQAIIDAQPDIFKKTKKALRRDIDAGKLKAIFQKEAAELYNLKKNIDPDPTWFEAAIKNTLGGSEARGWLDFGGEHMKDWLGGAFDYMFGPSGTETSTSLKERYGIKEIYNIAKKAAPETADDEDIMKMAAIAWAESRGNPQAHNPCTGAKRNPAWVKGSEEPKWINGDGRGCKNNGNSYGLWQINMIGDEEGDMGKIRRKKYSIGKNKELFDPDKNAKVAWALHNTKLGIGHWNVTNPTVKGRENPTYTTYKNKLKELRKKSKTYQEGVRLMNKKDLQDLVKEVLNENSGQGYAPYPYGSSVRDEEQPKEDYIEEWKAFCMDLIENLDSRIDVAKMLVKERELFEDVLDLAGQNQSIGEEILRKVQEARENKDNM